MKQSYSLEDDNDVNKIIGTTTTSKESNSDTDPTITDNGTNADDKIVGITTTSSEGASDTDPIITDTSTDSDTDPAITENDNNENTNSDITENTSDTDPITTDTSTESTLDTDPVTTDNDNTATNSENASDTDPIITDASTDSTSDTDPAITDNDNNENTNSGSTENTSDTGPITTDTGTVSILDTDPVRAGNDTNENTNSDPTVNNNSNVGIDLNELFGSGGVNQFLGGFASGAGNLLDIFNTFSNPEGEPTTDLTSEITDLASLFSNLLEGSDGSDVDISSLLMDFINSPTGEQLLEGGMPMVNSLIYDSMLNADEEDWEDYLTQVSLKEDGAQFYSLFQDFEVSLPDVVQTERYMFVNYTLSMTNLHCSVLDLNDIMLTLNEIREQEDNQGNVEIVHRFDITGLDMGCDVDLHWSYGWVSGGGTLRVESKTPYEEKTVSFEYLPLSNSFGGCETNLRFKELSYDAGLFLRTVFVVLRPLIRNRLNNAIDEICPYFQDFAMTQEDFLNELNVLFGASNLASMFT